MLARASSLIALPPRHGFALRSMAPVTVFRAQRRRSPTYCTRVDDLERLWALKEKGALSSEEFTSEKRRMLSSSHAMHPSDASEEVTPNDQLQLMDTNAGAGVTGEEDVDFGEGEPVQDGLVCRSARLAMNKRQWCACWQNTLNGMAANNELRLVLELPTEIRIYRHDGQFATSKKEDFVFVSGPSGDEFQAALESIVKQLDESDCQLLETIQMDDSRIQEALSAALSSTKDLDMAYKGCPLAKTTNRGLVLQALTRSIDEENHPNSDFEDADCKSYDYKRDGKRIECKSSMLGKKADGRFAVGFKSVKPAQHDELLLTFSTPDGVLIYLHDGQLWKPKTAAPTFNLERKVGKAHDVKSAIEHFRYELHALSLIAPMIHWDDPRVADTMAAYATGAVTKADEAYSAPPFAELSSSQSRGHVLSAIARQLEVMKV